MISSPTRIDVIGNTLALQWPNGEESYIEAPLLRSQSPSAENKGETDIFGQVSGGQVKTEYPNIKIIKVSTIGNYAIRILFSDGHSTGIYSWGYLRDLESLTKNS
ncbi:MAG: DUF971 domain-containing protein [Opitutales bacterium]|nr:DUF971 domain-containing protein [Opitutales bacterium]MDG1325270.1 DUF971 domain-containing protein [Opitutales bacterium]